MKHVLIPLLVPEDLVALPNAVGYLKAQNPLTVVVFHNPSLGITSESATKEVDDRITHLEKAKQDAANREDYPAAQQFRNEIESARMDRQDILREGWKKLTQEQRSREYDRLILAPFVEAFQGKATVRQIAWSEDILEGNLLITLANLGASWPVELPLGQYTLLTPRSVREQGKITMKDVSLSSLSQELVNAIPQIVRAVNPSPSDAGGATLPLPAAKKAVAAGATPKKSGSTREEKFAWYNRFHLSLKKSAKNLGIPSEGKSKSELITAVLDREFPVAVAA